MAEYIEEYREREEKFRQRLHYGDMARDAVEVGGGFAVSGFGGRYVEKIVMPHVTSSSTTADKLIAAAANNGPKFLLYYLLKKIGLKAAAAASMGSIGIDLLVRYTNNGVNPYSVYVKQYQILNDENANAMADTNVKDNPITDWSTRPHVGDWAERRKQYAAMRYGYNELESFPPSIMEQKSFVRNRSSEIAHSMYGMK